MLHVQDTRSHPGTCHGKPRRRKTQEWCMSWVRNSRKPFSICMLVYAQIVTQSFSVVVSICRTHICTQAFLSNKAIIMPLTSAIALGRILDNSRTSPKQAPVIPSPYGV